MGKSKSVLLPKQERIIIELGQNIKLARLRREITAEQVSERAGIARSTLSKLENGNPGVTVENLLKVLHVLGLEKDLLLIADKDELGRNLQDSKLLNIRK